MLLQASDAQAQIKSDWETQQDERNWQEIEVKLPAYPRDQDLVEFFVSSASAFRFYLDATSISIGPDGVVRFTLVARSASGATNVTFEGLRCKTREHRLYAFGRTGAEWSMRPTAWKKIEPKSVQRWHNALASEYFCKGAMAPFSTDEILRGLKSGDGLHPKQPPMR